MPALLMRVDLKVLVVLTVSKRKAILIWQIESILIVSEKSLNSLQILPKSLKGIESLKTPERHYN